MAVFGRSLLLVVALAMVLLLGSLQLESFSQMGPYERKVSPVRQAAPAVTAPLATIAQPIATQRELERLLIVTASSSDHFCWATQLVQSVRKHEPHAKLVFYDLGLTPEEAAWIQTVEGLEYRLFPYDRYPLYFNVKISAGQYAWKPAIVAMCLEEAEYVVWMDGGDLLHKSLEPMVQHLAQKGFYSGGSSGGLRRWTHPGTLKYLNVPDSLASVNCNAAFLAFSRKHTRETLVKDWLACALVEECIAPPGSSRSNHRQDQAVLSVLAAMSNGQFKCDQNHLSDLFEFHVEYNGRPCSDAPSSFAVGVPTSFSHVRTFYNSVFKNAMLLPSSKLLSIQLALTYATRLDFTHEQGPRIAVIAHDATHAFQQLSYGFGRNSLVVGISGKSPGADMLRVADKVEDKRELADGAGTTFGFIGARGVRMHFVEWKAAVGATQLAFDEKACKEITATMGGLANGLIIIDNAGSPMDVQVTMRTFKTVTACGSALVDQSKPWFAILESHGPMPRESEIASIAPDGTHQTVIKAGSDHHQILVVSSFDMPKGKLSQ